MQYPLFFECVESIILQDPLSAVLGAFENGQIEYTYLDVVKSAGHSCPTVAGAYLMTWRALDALYPDSIPLRGGIKVAFKEAESDGVAGVIGNVIAQITGATDKSGFKGLNGKFARHSLMRFSEDIFSSARFTRVDTGKSVDVFYDPSIVLPASTMPALMQKVMSGTASDLEKKEFGVLWQERVEKILCKFNDDESVIKVVEVS
ncbi:MAG TPA: hypothetical protein EYG95_02905 [Campylobacterales bacterium]|nr:hypothetical protein [Campylobacterales bacterium]